MNVSLTLHAVFKNKHLQEKLSLPGMIMFLKIQKEFQTDICLFVDNLFRLSSYILTDLNGNSKKFLVTEIKKRD